MKSEPLSRVGRKGIADSIDRLINYLTEAGFYKQGEVAFPHKQSAVMKIDRESWEAPAM